MISVPYGANQQPGTWHTREGVTYIVCPECATPNRVQIGHDGTAWVLCVNDFCTWQGRVTLGPKR